MLPYFSCTTADFEVKYLFSKVTVSVLVNTGNWTDFLWLTANLAIIILLFIYLASWDKSTSYLNSKLILGGIVTKSIPAVLSS